jgi:hypothetical protein
MLPHEVQAETENFIEENKQAAKEEFGHDDARWRLSALQRHLQRHSQSPWILPQTTGRFGL